MSSLWIVDIRRLYNYRALDSRLELAADIFNLFDNQNAIRNQDLLAGTDGNEFGNGIRFTPLRRVDNVIFLSHFWRGGRGLVAWLAPTKP